MHLLIPNSQIHDAIVIASNMHGFKVDIRNLNIKDEGGM